jgi:predicted nucleic acid-binding protein
VKEIFLDTDIILDFLGDRKPFSKFALQLFIKAHHKKLRLYGSGNSITTAYYILGKLTTEKQARELVVELMNHITIIPVSDHILYSAFNSNFSDVEDAVQFFCAATVKNMQCIVTRNIRDYKKSTIPILSSEEFLLRND